MIYHLPSSKSEVVDWYEIRCAVERLILHQTVEASVLLSVYDELLSSNLPT